VVEDRRGKTLGAPPACAGSSYAAAAAIVLCSIGLCSIVLCSIVRCMHEKDGWVSWVLLPKLKPANPRSFTASKEIGKLAVSLQVEMLPGELGIQRLEAGALHGVTWSVRQESGNICGEPAARLDGDGLGSSIPMLASRAAA
jgi:hypothetical protein